MLRRSLTLLTAALLVGTLTTPTANAQGAQTLSTSTLTAQSVHLFRQATDLTTTRLPISGTNLNEATTVTLTKNGKVAWSVTTNRRNIAYVNLPISTVRKLGTGKYTLKAVSGNLNATARVQVHRGWAPLARDAAGRFIPARYDRCSSLTWDYDATKAPKGTTGIIEDFTTVFDDYSRLTGLKITRAKNGAKPDITVNWDRLTGGDGQGGSAYTGTRYLYGTVTLGIDSEWARTPGLGETQRGGLLYHEVGHVLGLGHVNVSITLMNPVTIIGHTQHTPGANEIRGLNYLYAPSKC